MKSQYKISGANRAQSHALPQPSSASFSFGFVSRVFVVELITFGLGTFDFMDVFADFLVPAPIPRLPVLTTLVREGCPFVTTELDGLDSPLGSGTFAFAFACELSQPAKSGSPPSSKGVGVTRAGVIGASKKESSPISPHASSMLLSSA